MAKAGRGNGGHAGSLREKGPSSMLNGWNLICEGPRCGAWWWMSGSERGAKILSYLYA